jgi:hypothetical protein
MRTLRKPNAKRSLIAFHAHKPNIIVLRKTNIGKSLLVANIRGVDGASGSAAATSLSNDDDDEIHQKGTLKQLQLSTDPATIIASSTFFQICLKQNITGYDERPSGVVRLLRLSGKKNLPGSETTEKEQAIESNVQLAACLSIHKYFKVIQHMKRPHRLHLRLSKCDIMVPL